MNVHGSCPKLKGVSGERGAGAGAGGGASGRYDALLLAAVFAQGGEQVASMHISCKGLQWARGVHARGGGHPGGGA